MLSRTRIKICGIKTSEDACYAEQLGVDSIGLVFHESSPRHVTVAESRRIVARLGGMMSVVALFSNADSDFVKEVLAALPFVLPQFHGEESPDYCEQFSRPYIKAFGMGGTAIPETADINQYRQASAVLLDANVSGEMGGTGHSFDWSKIPTDLVKPMVLAGGLNASNVVPAIHQVRPYAVDVSSGVESERGVKSQQLMKKFVDNVRGITSE